METKAEMETGMEAGIETLGRSGINGVARQSTESGQENQHV